MARGEVCGHAHPAVPRWACGYLEDRAPLLGAVGWPGVARLDRGAEGAGRAEDGRGADCWGRADGVAWRGADCCGLTDGAAERGADERGADCWGRTDGVAARGARDGEDDETLGLAELGAVGVLLTEDDPVDLDGAGVL